MAKFLGHEEDTLNRRYFRRLTLMKKSHLTTIKTDTNMGIDTDSIHGKEFAIIVCANGSKVHVWLRSQVTCISGGVHSSIAGSSGLNKDFTPITVILLFMEAIHLFVTEINKYYNQYLDTLYDDGESS
jgi:hypothetical protein